MDSEILPFYSGCNILITGGTGLIGSLAIEKLLRACDDIGTIYLIIRKTKEKSTQERVNHLCSDVLFDTVRAKKPDFEKKIQGIEGDIVLDGLGLSEEAKKTIVKNVNVVFHCAAVMSMGDSVRKPIIGNVRGTSQLLDLCQEMPNFKAMVYVSTAFSNCTQYVIEEEIHPTTVSPGTLLKLVDETSEDVMKAIGPGLIQKWPNAYCYSKSAVENMISERSANLPLGIFRPSVVMNTHSEPVPGWISNFYGVTGLIVGCGVGVLRVARGLLHYHMDTVPADFCVNSMLCSAWEINKKWEERKVKSPTEPTVPIYNYASGIEKSLTWKDILDYCFTHDIPAKKRIWVPTMVVCENAVLYRILCFLLHLVPAFLIDAYLRLLGKKPRVMEAQDLADKYAKALEYFGFNEFDIKNGNVYRLWDRLNDADQKLFPFDMRNFSNYAHLKTCCNGSKVYLLKESMDDVEELKKRYQKMMKIHVAIKTAFKLLLIYFFCRIMAAIVFS